MNTKHNRPLRLLCAMVLPRNRRAWLLFHRCRMQRIMLHRKLRHQLKWRN